MPRSGLVQQTDAPNLHSLRLVRRVMSDVRQNKTMPIAAITGISMAGLAYQWYSDKGKTNHIGEFPWGAVECATVFKRDLFTYDLICLQLKVADDVIEFDEEDLNWKELVEAMPNHLSGCILWSDWFTEVAFPAFETKERLIYRK